MKKFKFIYISVLFAVSLLFIQSCENVIDGELPYEEKLVIKCILEKGKPTDYIFIGKTLSPMYTENYYGEIPDIIVEDAVGYISDSEKSYNLEYKGNSIYKAVDLVPKEGETYKLNVSWNGHIATSTTFIPTNPVIVSVKIVERGGKDYVEQVGIIKFKGQRNASYIPASLSKLYGYYNYGNPILMRSNSSSDTAEVEITNIWDYERDKYMSMELMSFPPEFLDFYNSKYQGGNSPDGIFSTSGINVKWNIKGAGIGLFLGQNTLPFDIEDFIK